MTRRHRIIALLSVALAACAQLDRPDAKALQHRVFAVERAFAKTMADRDHAAFARFVSEEAVFFSGPEPLHGRQAVAEHWKRFYEKPQAPFSWEPDRVEVIASGTLAISTGVVRDPNGKPIGRFNSIWRQEEPGVWRVLFDKGEPVCDCAQPAKP